MKHVVGFSGGGDSQACALWCRKEFGDEDTILLNADAGGNEHPITEAFIAEYSRRVHPVVVVSACVGDLAGIGTRAADVGDRRAEFSEADRLTFDRLAYIKGTFPRRLKQFCTTFLKLAPSRRWCQENLDAKGILYERYTGVRRDESERRKNTPLVRWDDYFGCVLNSPLATWSKQQCFDFVRAAGEEVNPLYTMGFERVGCAPCVNAKKADIAEWAARFPQMIDKVRGWELANKRTFFAPCVPGLAINWIDEVVAWSKTAWGGQQGLLDFVGVDVESGACVSNYGLCE